MHLRLIETSALVHIRGRVGVLLVDEAVAPINGSSSAGVHHVHLVSAVRLGDAVRHVDAGAAAQSLIALRPAQPLTGMGLEQGEHGQGQRQCEQQGDGEASGGVLQSSRGHIQVEKCGALTVKVSGDGTRLAFIVARPLTGVTVLMAAHAGELVIVQSLGLKVEQVSQSSARGPEQLPHVGWH
ncbi:hypothetical protein EYF80_044190 [Liparis tanakae]|uniref:Uncharacterized protein n=1 Tax=Liparis tanakae TaxID=230148 RepID=A0A4Z2FYG6_9TELE|nr:hypothetical protein EYF80_044190 [Liparis tanakae]